MKEYIERDAVLQNFKEVKPVNWDNTEYEKQAITDYNFYRSIVENTLAADVAPVVHGEWLQVKEPIGWKDIDCVMCSACEDKWIMDEEYDLDFYKEQWKYCPFCGAKMDGGNKQ